MAKEIYEIKVTYDCDHRCYEYHVYSSRTGFVITCQTLRQAKRYIAIAEAN